MLLSRDEKMYFLQLVNEKKDVLLGNFDGERISADSKKREWTDILGRLNARGVVMTKDWTHLRDTTWCNMKRATLVSIYYMFF